MLRRVFLSTVLGSAVTISLGLSLQRGPAEALAQVQGSISEPSNSEILGIIQKATGATRAERVLQVSEQFLDRPYELGPCGEGASGFYDKKPLARFDRFDCTTFVEAVLALAFVNPDQQNAVSEFWNHLKEIKYSDSTKVCFTNRNHFVSINWAPNAASKGYLLDITRSLSVDSIERMKWLDIDKWYLDKIKAIESSADPAPEKEKKIQELSAAGSSKPAVPLARMHYVPLVDLLKQEVMDKLRTEKVVLFNLIKNEHTKVNIPVIVGHQGFIVEKAGSLFIRHASSAKDVKKTIDVLFEDYVRERIADSTWPTLGMNVMKIVSD